MRHFALLSLLLLLVVFTGGTTRTQRSPPISINNTQRFANALANANTHDQLAQLTLILKTDRTIDIAALRLPGKQGGASPLLHVCKLHIFMMTAVNHTLAQARGQDLDVALKLAEALLKRGADATEQDAVHCLSPLHVSVWARDAALTKLLLEHGARCDVSMGLAQGYTPLSLAVEADERKTFAQLAQLKAALERGEWVSESAWGLEEIAITTLGGPPLRRETAHSIRINPAHRALFVDGLNLTLQAERGIAALGGPADGQRVGGALSEWRLSVLRPLLASGTCDLSAVGGAFASTALHIALSYVHVPTQSAACHVWHSFDRSGVLRL